MRIVSLLASGTEIVCALGLENALVGISHECDHPPEILDRPRVSRPRFDPDGLSSGEVDRAVREAMAEHGSVYAIDGDRLEALDPDLVLTQAVCEVCAVPTAGTREVIRERGLETELLSLDAHSLEDILETVEAVGRSAGAEARAAEFVAARRARLAEVRAKLEGASRPRVVALEWLDPPFAPGHWVPEQVELAGGENVLGEDGGPSREIDWDDLRGLDPDILVVMPCGFGVEASRRDAEAHAQRLLDAASRAVREERAFVVDGSSYFNRSGPRAFAGVEILAGLFHPDRFPVPSDEEARTWIPERARPRTGAAGGAPGAR